MAEKSNLFPRKVPLFLLNIHIHKPNVLEKDHIGTGFCPGSLDREVIQCRSRKGEGQNVKGERLRLRVRLRGWSREEKCQVTNSHEFLGVLV
jgi:hypothetical protein